MTERLRVDAALVRGGEGETAALPRDAAHHLRVARVPWGTRVVLFDGSGLERDATLDAGGATVTLAALARPGVGADGARVTWIQGYPKGDKLDTIVRQATELGVAALWPVYTARSVPQERNARSAPRLERWTRIAEEAARQSGRADVPELRAAAPLDEALAVPRRRRRPRGGLGVVGDVPLARAVPPGARGPVAVVAGPEGGLDAAEVARCEARGFVTPSPSARGSSAPRRWPPRCSPRSPSCAATCARGERARALTRTRPVGDGPPGLHPMSLLSALLTQDQVVSPKAIDEAISRQVINGGDFETSLLEGGAIGEDTLARYCAAVHGIPHATREDVAAADPVAIAKLPRSLAERHGMAALFIEAGRLIVAVAGPVSPAARIEVEAAVKLPLEARCVTTVRLAWALWRYYQVPLPPRFERIATRLPTMPPAPSPPT